ncbi:MAG TPA: EF-hand domain-containing protein [Noviherbaspirillum sp.]|nr:EF-hand domain-containing protein [Noviherbaspirillum sp.]
MRSTILLMIASATFGSSLAIAQSALVHVPTEKKVPHALSKFTERFMAADKNGDGALSREEAQAAGLHRIVDNFDRLDADGDGKVTLDEVRTLLKQQRPTI